jgi:hypothetical protein
MSEQSCTNCLTLNDTEARKEKGVNNRCLIFDDTDGNVGITEYGEQKRVSTEDALALCAHAWPPVATLASDTDALQSRVT